ncbi:threonine/serine exporter ThrE family protein [Leifsonia sp. NPDC058230]|uniref:threonine/serine ThrE exporter family protein n=1 Tax=Leifsonia sp. NPDC058230 TaxID=3346391 RepID=UPI0036DE88A4
MNAWRPKLRIPRLDFHARSIEATQYVESPSAQLQEFLVKLGSALLSVGTASTDIQRTLKWVAVALGSPHTALIVFPTIIFVGMPDEKETRFEVAESQGGEVRFDRAARIYTVVDQATAGTITASEGIAAIDAILAAKPRFNRVLRVLGHGLAAAGVGLVLLGADPISMLYAFVLGVLVGVAKLLVRPGTYAAILLPILTAFALALIVFAAARAGFVAEPLQVLVPPLVTLLPGAVLTTGIQELAAGDMVAGSSRLVSGIAQLLFLAFGIIAALTITGVPASIALFSSHPPLGAFQPWLGVLLFSLGLFFYYCGPRRSFYFLTLVLLVAYGGQLLGNALMGSAFSGFFGALALTLVAYLVQSIPGAPPAVVCFLPAFWLLVPGATGLIGLTQSAAGTDIDASTLTALVGSIVSIALGVLSGTALYRQIFRIAPARWRLRLV